MPHNAPAPLHFSMNTMYLEEWCMLFPWASRAKLLLRCTFSPPHSMHWIEMPCRRFHWWLRHYVDIIHVNNVFFQAQELVLYDMRVDYFIPFTYFRKLTYLSKAFSQMLSAHSLPGSFWALLATFILFSWAYRYAAQPPMLLHFHYHYFTRDFIMNNMDIFMKSQPYLFCRFYCLISLGCRSYCWEG